MKKHLSIFLGIILGISATASVTNQFFFIATNSLPSQVGDFNSSYYSTNNPNVAAMITLTTNGSGGLLPPTTLQFWTFSQSQQVRETTLRTDIIAPASSPDTTDFTSATYAERDSAISMGTTNQNAWRYYGFTNQSRLYFGSDVPSDFIDGVAKFAPPTPDIPATVTNGQTWTRITYWNSTFAGVLPTVYQFTDNSTADAVGTLALPDLGNVPALRIHEVHVYYATDLYGDPVDLHTNRYYYWLVPGLGVAVQVFQFGANIYDPYLPCTNAVERMNFASYYTPPLQPQPTNSPIGLHIQLSGESVLLNWHITNSTSYQILTNGSLATTNWHILGLTSGTNWTDTLRPTPRFYRVVGLP